MGTWNAFYVKASDDDAIMTVRAEFPHGEIDADSEFLSVALSTNEYKPPKTKLARISRRLKTEVIWLSIQTSVDAFQYHRWSNGRKIRSLVFGAEEQGVWEEVEGVPERWEREVFFTKEERKLALRLAFSETEKNKVRNIWKKGNLIGGETLPRIPAGSVAQAIGRIYKFSHYESWSL